MAFDLGAVFTTFKTKTEGFPEAVKQVKSSTSEISKYAGAAKKVGIGLAAGGAALTLYAKKATDFTAQLVKDTVRLSRETGENEQNISRLMYVMRRVGIDTDAASTIFGIFSKNITNATASSAANKIEQEKLAAQIAKTKFEIKTTSEEIKKNGDKSGELGIKLRGLQVDLKALEEKMDSAGTAFDRIGVKTVDAQGKQRAFSEVLFDVADKFEKMPDGAQKTTLALELFGRSGKDMLKVLNMGSDGIKNMMAQADKLGITLNKETIASFAKYSQSAKDLEDSSNAVKIAVGSLTAPVLTDFNLKLNEMVQRVLQAPGPMKDIIATFLAFGGPTLTAAGSVLTFVGSLKDAWPVIQTVAGYLKTPWTLALGAAGFAAVGFTKNLIENNNALYHNYQNALPATAAMVQLGVRTSELKMRTVETNPVLNALAHEFSGAAAKARESQLADEALTRAHQDLKNKTNDLRNATLNQQSASIAVERAQRTYTDAVRQYGPKSLEAREAELQLKAAKDRSRDASNQLKDATNRVKDARKADERAQDDWKRKSESTKQALASQKGFWESLGEAIARNVNKSMSYIKDLQIGQSKVKGGGWAYGGFTGRGQKFDVAGVVHKGEYVIPKEHVDQNTGMPKYPAGGGLTMIISMDGANITSPQVADEYGEIVGDSIMRKLQNNVRV